MDVLNRSYMAKSKRMTKSDYIEQLLLITQTRAEKLTVKQIRTLLAKYALG